MTTHAQDRRRQLIALLDQYPMEREMFLHEGRRAEAPRDEFADAIEKLFDPSLFQQVMEASKNYVERFGGKNQFHGAARKMQEEYFEFQHAVGDYASAMTDDTPLSLRLKSPSQFRKEAAQEMIDLFVTVGGLAATIGLTFEDIEQAARETLAKLNSRTTDTHAWNEDTKTVERIGKGVKS